MDPYNGDILAMANAPTFDPQRPTRVASDEPKQNRAAQHIYEPGSTFKSFIAAAALEVLHMSPYADVRRQRRPHPLRRRAASTTSTATGRCRFTDVFVKSSNVGAIKIGLELGPEVISRYVSRFGFGETLARDIPHQRAGLVDRNMADVQAERARARCRWATRSA